MGRFVTACLLLSIASSVGGNPLADARDDPPAALPPDGMATLNSSLERIADALESLRVDQRVLLTLRRLELAERRIAPLQNRLERARQDVRASEEEIAHLETVRQQFESAIQDAVRAGRDPASIPERSELDRVRAMSELARERLADAQRREIEAEDDMAASRRRIEILDEVVETLFQELED